MNLVVKAIAGILIVLYPFAVYFGLEHFEPKYLALLLAIIVITRFIGGLISPGLEKPQLRIATAFLGLLLVVIAFISNSIDSLKVYPVIISFTFLTVFGYSLLYPPTMIERLARLTRPDLPEKAVSYTRKITQIWCVFFLLNGVVALFTAVYTSLSIWTLYNGFLSYLIMGSLFLGEFVYRKLFIEE